METPLTVSAVARRFGVPPRSISDLFYRRKLSDTVCPVVEGRRMIPLEYLPTVERVMQEVGVLKTAEPAHV
ncbi:MAG: hypothetical protein EXS05_12345 [Planctomycetaceae bacterium]|nr:hypothetical protein [Planctomycetaceae bacterium]